MSSKNGKATKPESVLVPGDESEKITRLNRAKLFSIQLHNIFYNLLWACEPQWEKKLLKCFNKKSNSQRQLWSSEATI